MRQFIFSAKVNLFVLLLSQTIFAGYHTPNTGIVWNFDSLVANSNGVVIGSFPTYTMNDTVIISENDVVVVQAGSFITLSQTSIVIDGVLRAIGTTDSLIRFSGSTPTPASWKELRFEDTSVDSLCVLDYCIVEYSDKSINCINASPTISHCTIRYNNNYGIQCFGSNAIIRNDSIYNNVQYGINITVNASPLIENCVIANNNTQNTGPKNQISIGTQGINSPIVRNNEIYGSTNIKTGGISISALIGGSGSNAIIENNYIHNNSFGIAVLGSNINAIIRNNRIINNNINPNPLQAGSGINVNSSSSPAASPIIAGNIIRGNIWGITIQGIAQPNIGNVENADTADDGKNVFENNGHNDSLFALYNNTANHIYAQNNDWATPNPDSIASIIFDSADVSGLGVVTFLPILPPQCFFPLHIGNLWRYGTAIVFGEIKVISDTVLSNGKEYAVRNGYGVFTDDFIRQDGNRVFVFDSATNTEKMIYDFSKQVGDTVSVNYSTFDTTVITVYSIGYEEIFGAMRKQWVFFERSLEDSFYSLDRIVDSVGLYDGRGGILTGAIINGHLFGTMDVKETEKAKQVELFQNYPNPFNTKTVISFQLKVKSVVTLNVYNVLGKEVATLIHNRLMDEEKHEIEFDASNLTSGIYFYRLRSGNFSETQKLLLLK
ncbi:MAG: T9SS type A sorting domain-containing protein [Ignavibacteriales bacterium]|nr:T9SS type A sorting domain-containing protein [Ignavibacteriales bacterium]